MLLGTNCEITKTIIFFWKEHKHELASVLSVLYREVEIEKVSLGDSYPIKGP